MEIILKSERKNLSSDDKNDLEKILELDAEEEVSADGNCCAGFIMC